MVVIIGCLFYLGDYYYHSFKEKSDANGLAKMIEEKREEAMKLSMEEEQNDVDESEEAISPTQEESLTQALTNQEKSTSGNVSSEKDSNQNEDQATINVEDITPSAEQVLKKNVDSLGNRILYQYGELYEYNNDLIGWLKIDGTIIDYPVVQADDNEFYLDKGIDKEYTKSGTLFLDARANVLDERSTNLIIYGHHMHDNTMFGSLFDYDDEEFYKEHPFIQFDTLYEEGYYEIVSVFYSKIYNVGDVGFRYYQLIEAEDEEAFQSYIYNIKRLEIYKTNVVPTYGDELLTLSTCSYHTDNGRFVVIARKIK